MRIQRTKTNQGVGSADGDWLKGGGFGGLRLAQGFLVVEHELYQARDSGPEDGY